MAQGSLAIQSKKRNRGIMFGYCERLPRRILYSLEDALRRHTGCIAFFAALAVFEGFFQKVRAGKRLPRGGRIRRW